MPSLGGNQGISVVFVGELNFELCLFIPTRLFCWRLRAGRRPASETGEAPAEARVRLA